MLTFSRILVLGVLVALPTRSEDWPRFRGPTGQGHSSETRLPTSWTPDQGIRWKTEIPGIGWSSPIVWRDQVLVTTVTDDNTRCRILAFDRSSGKLLWNTLTHEMVPLRKEQKNSYASPTPVTDGQRVYAVFGDGI